MKDAQRFNHQLLFTYDRISGMKHCSLFAALNNLSTTVSDIEYPSRNPESLPVIIGIVNGLVCYYVEDDFYIWNPILKQSKHLPRSSKDSHGFGYDESNDDYKFVVVMSVGVYQVKVMVYSLRRDSWSVIEGVKDGAPEGNGTYVNGKIFWEWSCSGEKKWKFFSLDMMSDKCEVVQVPCYEFGAYDCLAVSFGGSLSMLCLENERRKFDLWVMDKTGVEESWSKVFSLPSDLANEDPANEEFDQGTHSFENVVCILGDGEIVLENKSCLTVYSTKKKDLRNVQLDGGLYVQFFVYVESLVPV